MNKKKVFMLMVLGVLLMSSIGLTKIKCEEKQKSPTGEKYLECEGGAKIEQVFGTEYIQGQNGTVFLQLLDNDGEVFNINNQTLLCQLEVWNPNKTKIVNTAMTELGEDGLYYYDINPIFNDTGVYMLSSVCYVPVYANSSLMYYRTNATWTDYLGKDQGNVVTEMDIVVTDEWSCEPITYFQEEEPYDHFFYLSHVNSTTYWDKLGGALLFDLQLRVFRQNIITFDNEFLGSQTLENIEISGVVTEVNFSVPINAFIDEETERIEVDLCSRRGTGASPVTISFQFNGNTTGSNSSLTKYAFERNVSLGYQEIRGSGEIHVSPREVFLGSQANQNMVWLLLFAGLVVLFLVVMYFVRQ